MVSYGQKMFTTTAAEPIMTVAYSSYPSLNAVQLDAKSVVIDFTSVLDKPTIGFGMSYTHNSLDFDEYDRFHDYSAFEDLHSIEVFARYKKVLANNWDVNAVIAPYLSSTFNEAISGDDFILSYAANITKNWDNDGLQSSIKIGAGYGALFGKPNFYPLISYAQDVNEKLRYEIGLPVTGVFYKLNQQSSFDVKAEPESIYANNASSFSLADGTVIYNSELEFTALKLGLGYQFNFDDNWSTYLNMGYLFASDLSLRETENTIYDFDSTESLSLNIGISFNINKK